MCCKMLVLIVCPSLYLKHTLASSGNPSDLLSVADLIFSDKKCMFLNEDIKFHCEKLAF